MISRKAMAKSNGKVRVSIWHESGYDEEEGVNIDTTVIDVHDIENDFGCGFMALDRPGDVILLRDLLDLFIREHNIQPSNHIDHE